MGRTGVFSFSGDFEIIPNIHTNPKHAFSRGHAVGHKHFGLLLFLSFGGGLLGALGGGRANWDLNNIDDVDGLAELEITNDPLNNRLYIILLATHPTYFSASKLQISSDEIHSHLQVCSWFTLHLFYPHTFEKIVS